jgi:predicted phage tail protein
VKRILMLLVFGSSLTFLVIVGLMAVATATAGNPQPTALVEEAEPPAAEVQLQSPAAQTADAAARLAEFEISLDARDRAYQAQIAAAEKSLQDRETAYQAQLQSLMQDKLAAQQKALTQEQSNLGIAQANAAKLQKALAAADAAFQSEMQAKTDQLSTDETQMQDQIKQVYADLQAAYDEIAARQANSGGDGGHKKDKSSGNSGGSKEKEHEHEHEDEHDD